MTKQNQTNTTKRTVEIVLENDPDLSATLSAFQQLCHQLSPICWNNGKPKSRRALHDAAYHQVKGKLSAQMTQTAIRFVAGCYTKRKRRKLSQPVRFKRPFAVFLVGERGRDARFCPDGTLSLWTVAGRKRLAYSVPPYARSLLANALRIDSLRVRERKGKLIGEVTVTLPKPEPKGSRFFGVDLNVANPLGAVSEEGDVFFQSGVFFHWWKRRFRRYRARLQRKLAERKGQRRDTRSVRRRLQHLWHRQRNFTRTYCHTVAKRFIDWCGAEAVIGLEDLKGLRKRVEKENRSAAVNRKVAEFPYGLLARCLVQKAELRGIEVVKVHPFGTSVTCSRCGGRGERQRYNFFCPSCRWVCHADINAAWNILRRARWGEGKMPCPCRKDAVGRPSVVPLQRLAALPEVSVARGMQAPCPLGDGGSPNRSFYGCGQGSQ